MTIKDIPYLICKLLSWLFLKTKYDLRVTGQQHVPPSGPFILASNHVSFLDPLVIGVSCPRQVVFLAREDLGRNALMALYLKAMRVIPLKRGESDLGAIREAIRRLQSGRPVALFPEGTRQAEGRLGQAKRGIGLLATKAQVPIVPVYVKGTYEALPRDAKQLQPSKIRVAFGPQISYTYPDLSPSGPLQSHADVAPPGEEQAGTPEERPAAPSRSQHQDQLAEAVTRRWQQLAESLEVR